MRVALLGYGKMGQTIERIASDRGHQIVLIVDERNAAELTVSTLSQAEVAIDFSTPSVVRHHINLCFEAGVPLIVGTTGWYSDIEKVKSDCIYSNNSLLYGSNFSLGVNIFFSINKTLARVMNAYKQYDVSVEEIHHTQKLDSPSGTAITLAEGILSEIERKREWVNDMAGSTLEVSREPEQLIIESHRLEDVPGTHNVIYNSEIDRIEIKHTAYNRSGFALGAVIAAEWIKDRKGFYSVEDIFSFNI